MTDPAPSTVTGMVDLLEQYFALGLHVIPLDRGSKRTTEPDWAARGETAIEPLVERTARHLGLTAGAVAAELLSDDDCRLNFGVLNEASSTVVLDIDDDRAVAALEAGLAFLHATCPDFGGIVWRSPRGIKRLWRRPKALDPGIVALRHRARLSDGVVRVQTLVELRSSGQDVLPGSWRDDVEGGFRITLVQPLPARLPAMPAPLVTLFRRMREDGELVRVMQQAAGVDVALTGLDPVQADEYPRRLAARVAERATISGALSVEYLLTKHGYTQQGRRWREPGSSHASGIAPPKPGITEHWQCWHESSPLAGQFDAWRAFVELEHGGDLAAAIAAARDLPSRLRVVRHDSGDEPDTSAPVGKPDQIEADVYEVDDGPQVILPTLSAVSRAFRDGQMMSGGDLYRHWEAGEIVAPTSLVRGVIQLYPGLFLVSGHSKGGKSLLALQWALAMAYGKGLTLGGIESEVDSSRVLYVTLDDASEVRMIKRAVDVLTEARVERTRFANVLDQVDFAATWPPEQIVSALDEGEPTPSREDALIATLERGIRERRPYRFVIIDTLVAWEMVVSTRDVVRGQYDAVRPLQMIAQNYGVIVMLIGHNNKAKFDYESPFMSISGSQGRPAAADGMMVLHRVSADASRRRLSFFAFRGRDGEDQEFTMELDGIVWRHAGPGSLAKNSGKGYYNEIVEVLYNEPIGSWMKGDDIIEAIREMEPSAKPSSIRNQLRTMSRDGTLMSQRGRNLAGYQLSTELRLSMAATRKF